VSSVTLLETSSWFVFPVWWRSCWRRSVPEHRHRVRNVCLCPSSIAAHLARFLSGVKCLWPLIQGGDCSKYARFYFAVATPRNKCSVWYVLEVPEYVLQEILKISFEPFLIRMYVFRTVDNLAPPALPPHNCLLFGIYWKPCCF